jgi:hypothetical protein
MTTDPLNRIVSPVGERLRKQWDVIQRLEHRESIIKTVLKTYDADAAIHIIQTVLDGEWDDPSLTS